ncbi:endonuclease V [Metallosphaera javensis (ex Sakai et al. 2022)]|uniref:endonuclease V n=1 Tax=Metallosphaera javensis (ex Sakai et al. 2022) TaxID=2775498 RepID=UPI002588B441
MIAKQVNLVKLEREPREMCGVDVAYKGEMGVAVVVCDGETQIIKKVKGRVSFPYIPGLLFMREAPLMVKALEDVKPDLLLVDGHGIAHPRRSGIATVLGVLLETPTVGVAKSRLVGEIVEEGGVNYVTLNGERVGVKVGKYYYSPGNLVSLDDVIQLSKMGYPKVLREADRLSKVYRNEMDIS